MLDSYVELNVKFSIILIKWATIDIYLRKVVQVVSIIFLLNTLIIIYEAVNYLGHIC